MKTNQCPIKVVGSVFLAVSFLFSQVSAFAADLPDGYQAVSGASSYQVLGNTGTLTATDTVTIGQWNQGFNVGSGKTFEALLPTNGAHLSRDITSNPSQIFGSVNVPQGKFFLVNTNGVYFSSCANVNAAGFVASTLDINDQDFLNGNYLFNQAAVPGTQVVNRGHITVGDGGVALIGAAVENSGTVTAVSGNIVLASGKQMTLSFDAEGLTGVVVSEAVDAPVADEYGNNHCNHNSSNVNDGVLNDGTLRADGGIVTLTAEAVNGVFDNLVNNRCIVEADTTVDGTGTIELSSNSEGVIRNSGSLKARGFAGDAAGSVSIVGDTIILDNGRVDVSGTPDSTALVTAISKIRANNARFYGDALLVSAGDIDLGYIEAGNLNTTANGDINDINSCGLNVNADAWTAYAIGSVEADTSVSTLDVTADTIEIWQECKVMTVTNAIATGDLEIYSNNNMGVLLAVSNGDLLKLSTCKNLAVDTVVGSATGTVNLYAGQAITDLNGAGTTNVYSQNLVVRGNSGINLDTEVETLCAVSGSGNIVIRETDALSFAAETCGGSVTVTTGGEMRVEHLLAGGAGDVYLTTTAGDVLLDDITAKGDLVDVNSAGAIFDINGKLLNVESQVCDLSAVTGIGTASNTIEVKARTLITSTVSGGVYVTRK